MINFKQLNPKKDVLVIFGATASGKSDFAIKIANSINSVIINADSSQIYKEAPILSNLPSSNDFYSCPHKLFAYLSITQESSVVDWLNLCVTEINKAKENNQLPIVVGGSGMYISSLLYGISDIPSNLTAKNKSIESYNKLGHNEFFKLIQNIDPLYTAKVSDKQRLIRAYEVYLITNKPFSFYINQDKRKYIETNFINIFLNPSKNTLYEKINQRTIQMFNKNISYEVLNILKLTNKESHIKKILGLNEAILYINQQIPLEVAISKIQQKTRNYAKRQITWFKNKIKDKIILENINEFFNNF